MTAEAGANGANVNSAVTNRAASKSLLIAGGGTGGHVFPAIAVAREWLRREPEGARSVVIVGTQAGMESRLVPQAGLPLETIRAAGLKGMGGAKLARNLALLPAGLWDSEKIVQRHHFNVAFGVGGYASRPNDSRGAPARRAHHDFRAKRRAGFHQSRPCEPRQPRGLRFCGNRQAFWRSSRSPPVFPCASEFFSIARKEHREPFNILITGGSRGALPINRAIVDSLDILGTRKNQLFIVHQTGERDYNAVRVAYARREFRAEVVPFIENMAERFAQADLILCRSGAITTAEVAAAGRAAIFIPFGAATDAHQTRNAEAMQNAGAARLLPQTELTPERLTKEIFTLLDQPRRITEMEEQARRLARPRAVEDIVDLLEGLVRA